LLVSVPIVSLLWLVYCIGVAVLVPRQLRLAALGVGLRLDVGAARSLYPGELRLRDVELHVPSLGALVSARQVVVAPSWRGLFSSAPLVESARASGIVLRWEHGSLGPLEARVRRPSAARGEPDDGVLEIHGAGALWQTASHAGTSTLRASFEVQYDEFEPGRAARAVLGDGVLEVSDIALVEPPRGAPLVAASDGQLGMQAMLRLENATFDAERGFEAAGRLYLKGEDAGIGLELVGAGASVRWMLSMLEGQSFVVEASSRACGSGVALDGIRFESGLTGARGALRATAEGWSGVLQARRGSFSLGVGITPSGVQTLLSPQPFWLDVELGRIRDVCAAGGS
jgi:hypothetical protein